MILLSPKEEEEIAAQLTGLGWYEAVGEIIARDGPTNVVPLHDWRYAWVRDTLRRLESAIPILTKETESCSEWPKSGDYPFPPPPKHPLRSRPRVGSESSMSAMRGERDGPSGDHGSFLGPPYSLLVVENPNASNAFSYGFGPDGGGGVVVYTGFLDDILSRIPSPNDAASPEPVRSSWWTILFGCISTSPPPPSWRPRPTPEQTSDLAVLLAHELSHLILAHHLETLSSISAFIPYSLDYVRALIFPVTMLLGPFVSDAVAQLVASSSGKL